MWEASISLLAVGIAVWALYIANLRRAEIVLFTIELPDSRQPALIPSHIHWHNDAIIHFAAFNNGARGGILDCLVQIKPEGPPGLIKGVQPRSVLVNIANGRAELQALEAGDMLNLTLTLPSLGIQKRGTTHRSPATKNSKRLFCERSRVETSKRSLRTAT